VVENENRVEVVLDAAVDFDLAAMRIDYLSTLIVGRRKALLRFLGRRQ
jgi:hypothetical protein